MLTHCTPALTPLCIQACHSKNSGWVSQLWGRQVVTHSLQWLQIKQEVHTFTNLRVPVLLATSVLLFFPLVFLGPQKQEAQVDLRGHYFGCSLCLECSFSGFTHGSLPLFRPILLKCHPTSPNLAWSTVCKQYSLPLARMPNHPILFLLYGPASRLAYRMLTCLHIVWLPHSPSSNSGEKQGPHLYSLTFPPRSSN